MHKFICIKFTFTYIRIQWITHGKKKNEGLEICSVDDIKMKSRRRRQNQEDFEGWMVHASMTFSLRCSFAHSFNHAPSTLHDMCMSRCVLKLLTWAHKGISWNPPLRMCEHDCLSSYILPRGKRMR